MFKENEIKKVVDKIGLSGDMEKKGEKYESSQEDKYEKKKKYISSKKGSVDRIVENIL